MKMKCYKTLKYKQFLQISGLCGLQFLSYLPKRFTHLLGWSWKNLQQTWISAKKRHFCCDWSRTLPDLSDQPWLRLIKGVTVVTQESKKTTTTTKNSKTTSRHRNTVEYNARNVSLGCLWRDFFQSDIIPFWCHALWKLGSSICCIFEMKHASGLETCTKIYFLFILNLV